jgi:aryl sulfotransferase
MLTRPRDEVVAELEAQRHRRFIKTHTPLDGVPWNDHVTYIDVGRARATLRCRWATTWRTSTSTSSWPRW